MITMARAAKARDELVDKLGFNHGPQSGVTGIGIGRENGAYVLFVDVTRDDIDLPEDVQGVPVRAVVTPMPRANRGVSPAYHAGQAYGRDG
jgi:hypothetical protein